MSQTKEVSEWIRKLIKAGWTVNEIAAHPYMGVSPETVQSWKKGRSVPISVQGAIAVFKFLHKRPEQRPRELRRRWSMGISREIRNAHLAGWPYTRIAKFLDISAAAVRNYANLRTAAPAHLRLKVRRLRAIRKPYTQAQVCHRVMLREVGKNRVWDRGNKELARLTGYNYEIVAKYLAQLEQEGLLIKLSEARAQNTRWLVVEKKRYKKWAKKKG